MAIFHNFLSVDAASHPVLVQPSQKGWLVEEWGSPWMQVKQIAVLFTL